MRQVADVAAMVVVVAGIMVLVRRGSQGPQLANAVMGGFASVISAATGGGTF